MIHVLGSQGSVSQKGRSTSFLVAPSIAVDAGNLLMPLGIAASQIEHLFLTHSHFDHIADLPFMMTSYIEARRAPLCIYALPATLDALTRYLFNGEIWPDFTCITLPDGNPVVVLVPINCGETIMIDDYEIMPVKAEHLVPTCGFQIGHGGEHLLISGDTYINPALIERLNSDRRIKTLLIDVSFTSDEAWLAEVSMHLTPLLVHEMFEALQREDLTVYTYHQKPGHETQIDAELERYNILRNGGRRLHDGDRIAF